MDTKKFYKIEYIDALYFTTKKISFEKFKIHVTLGKIINKNSEYLTVVFKEKNNKPFTGLILPTNSIVNRLSKYSNKFINKFNVDDEVGIYWDDLVYFDNGSVPKKQTPMYTEGRICKIFDSGIIVSNPTTIKIKKRIENHPEVKTTFVAIPFSLIKSIDKYE